MLRKFRHKNGKFYVKVDTRRGKPIVDSRGFITLVGEIGYRGCQSINEEEFNDAFPRVMENSDYASLGE